jgi:hypothetical protein
VGGRIREDRVLRWEGYTTTDAGAVGRSPLHIKGDAGASVFEFLCDGTPVLIRELALSPTRRRSELQPGIEEEVMAKLWFAQDGTEIQLLERLSINQRM